MNLSFVSADFSDHIKSFLVAEIANLSTCDFGYITHKIYGLEEFIESHSIIQYESYSYNLMLVENDVNELYAEKFGKIVLVPISDPIKIKNNYIFTRTGEVFDFREEYGYNFTIDNLEFEINDKLIDMVSFSVYDNNWPVVYEYWLTSTGDVYEDLYSGDSILKNIIKIDSYDNGMIALNKNHDIITHSNEEWGYDIDWLYSDLISNEIKQITGNDEYVIDISAGNNILIITNRRNLYKLSKKPIRTLTELPYDVELIATEADKFFENESGKFGTIHYYSSNNRIYRILPYHSAIQEKIVLEIDLLKFGIIDIEYPNMNNIQLFIKRGDKILIKYCK